VEAEECEGWSVTVESKLRQTLSGRRRGFIVLGALGGTAVRGAERPYGPPKVDERPTEKVGISDLAMGFNVLGVLGGTMVKGALLLALSSDEEAAEDAGISAVPLGKPLRGRVNGLAPLPPPRTTPSIPSRSSSRDLLALSPGRCCGDR